MPSNDPYEEGDYPVEYLIEPITTEEYKAVMEGIHFMIWEQEWRNEYR